VEKIIKKKFRQDCISIMAFMIFMWAVLTYVMVVVYGLIPEMIIKIVAIIVWLTTISFATSALIATLIHLRKNSQDIYREDILNSRIF